MCWVSSLPNPTKKKLYIFVKVSAINEPQLDVRERSEDLMKSCRLSYEEKKRKKEEESEFEDFKSSDSEEGGIDF